MSLPHSYLYLGRSIGLILVLATSWTHAVEPDVLPGTAKLTVEGDIASEMVAGVDRFLLRELEASIEKRSQFWQRDVSTPEAYAKSVATNRQRLMRVLGVRDRVPPGATERAVQMQVTTDVSRSAVVGRGRGFEVQAVRWNAFADVTGEGLLLVPKGRDALADVVAIPDADQLPEQLVGLTEGIPAASQFARRLAEQGCRVLVPSLISRERQRRAPPGQPGRANMTHREYIYRSAFELGRHLIGYEVQKVQAGIDWFQQEADGQRPLGVIGYGEGGMLALYVGAIDERVDVTGVSGFVGSRQTVWQQPLDRNLFGLLTQFGDAEVASLVAPRQLVLDRAAGPQFSLPSGEGGAPAELAPQPLTAIEAESARLKGLVGELPAASGQGAWATTGVTLVGDSPTPFCGTAMLRRFFTDLGVQADSSATPPGSSAPEATVENLFSDAAHATQRQVRQLHELDRHNQALLLESPYVRAEFMKGLDTRTPEAYAKTVERYRTIFRDDVVGRIDQPLLAPQPRSRKLDEQPKWTAYEVMLDVFPDVFAYGILCIPKQIPEGERRPVVVCQHGLEGRPLDIVQGDHPAYHDFATKLAERGFVTFSPQNIYIFGDRFRTLQRKANPLQLTLFSIMVPQHQQIVDWLQTLPYVDGERIGFYGLSYGGKSAMRIPALVTDYCLSICSADFNEWVGKNASTRIPQSYMWTGEYEIFEFDLGSTFNYAEMAALICPRPFMVERGHFDGVAADEHVGYEFAKVRHLYQARLGLKDRAEIEWFVGPHTIHGQGTFAFLHRHLHWPEPDK